MDIIKVVESLNKSLTKKQKEELMHVANECKNLGAKGNQLAPLYAVYVIGGSDLTKEEIEHGRKLEKEYELKNT